MTDVTLASKNINKNSALWSAPRPLGRTGGRARRTLGKANPGSATHPPLGGEVDRRVAEACEQLAYLLPRIAGRFARRLPAHVELDDLVGAGSVGLVAAVQQHIHKPMPELRRLAEQRVRGAILDYLRSLDHLTRRQRAAVTALRRARTALDDGSGRDTDVRQVARAMGVTVARVEHIQNRLAAVQLASFEDQQNVHGDEPDPAAWTAHRQMKAQVAGALATLPERLQTLLSLYYCESLTYKEIGDILGVSRSRVCQLHNQAIEELRLKLTPQAA